MKQQSKLEWLNNGDCNTRFFFAKMRQRKQSNYVYSINNDRGEKVEGFPAVEQVMKEYYQKLLGKQSTNRTTLDQDVMQQGPALTIDQ